MDHSPRTRSASRAHWWVLSLLVLAAASAYLYTQRQTAVSDQEAAERLLKSMTIRGRRIRALRQAAEAQRPVEQERGPERPLIEFIEEAAGKRRVKITNLSPRPPVETRRTVLARTRVVTEQETWVQIAEARLESLVLFLHEIETELPDYFVKEISGLVPNEGKGDNWRARIVLSTISTREETPDRTGTALN